MTAEPELLLRLQNWYAEQCDGEWEHNFGFTIKTLDNPGWHLAANVAQPDLETEPETILSFDNGEGDWIHCEIKNGKFLGASDSTKLKLMIETFLDYMEKRNV